MNNRKTFCIVVPKDATDEEIDTVRKKAEKIYGLDHDVEVVRADSLDNGIVAEVLLEDNYQGYAPIDRPSKEELRTSPYARFDKFHKKKRR